MPAEVLKIVHEQKMWNNGDWRKVKILSNGKEFFLDVEDWESNYMDTAYPTPESCILQCYLEAICDSPEVCGKGYLTFVDTVREGAILGIFHVLHKKDGWWLFPPRCPIPAKFGSYEDCLESIRNAGWAVINQHKV